MAEDTTKFYRTAGATGLILWVALIGFILSVLIILIQWRLDDLWSIEVVVCLIAAPGFLVFYFWTKGLAADGRPILEITTAGLLARDISEAPIAWRDINGMSLQTVMGQPILSLEVGEEAIARLPLTLRARIGRAVSTPFGRRSLAINLSGVDADLEALLTAIAARIGSRQ